MRDASSNAKDRKVRRDRILAITAVLLIVVIALFVRAYWNIDAAQTEDGFVFAGGSDPYYHWRATSHIAENWETLGHDPLLNYPYGAVNPNPPLFHWSVAVAGAAISPFFGGDSETATWWAMLWAPAVWGALAVIPAYLIGRDVFDRRAGVVAALFLALSTASITKTSFGNSEHDAMYLFFAVLGFWTYLRMIKSFRSDLNWVPDWRDAGSIRGGLTRFLQANRAGFLWALGTGLSVAAVALMWKGFPYLIGVMFVYLAVQLVVDHWRNHDSTGVWAGTLLAFLVATLIAVPVYANQNVLVFLRPVWFLIGATAVMGLVMVPTRDLPTILVIPAFVVGGILGVISAFFVFPDVARSFLHATVYFRRSAIYETIAEAHPADFSTLVFSVGPVAFFLAIAGVVLLLVHARRQHLAPMLFLFTWSVIAIYMAHSAVRFTFNAAPILAILAGWTTILIFDWVNFRGISRAMAAAPNFWSGVRRGVNGWHVGTAVLVALLLVFPNVFLAVDAGTPSSYDQERARESDFYAKRFGAFGQSFLPEYWRSGFGWLAGLDDFGSDPGNEANRPGFVSWWDYGHWAIVAGQHPSVADNFQNGYEYAAHFLLSQNETHAVQLMSARSFDLLRDRDVDPQALVEQAGVDPADSEAVVAALDRFEFAPQMSLEQAVALEALVTENTKDDLRPDGVRIRYFAADVRMLPYDDPGSNFIDQPSIFYAPVVLKGDDPDAYVTTMIRDPVGNYLTRDQFEQAMRQVTMNAQFGATGSRYEYQEPFVNSMYYRTFVGTPMFPQQPGAPMTGAELNQALTFPQPGYDMKHWRLAYASPQLRMLEYFKGAELSGTVTEDDDPIAGARVTVYDDAGHMLWPEAPPQIRDQTQPEDFNVPHDSTVTDENGAYRVILPFSKTHGITVIVTDEAGAELSRHNLNVTREDAEAQRPFTHDFIVEKGNVEGFAFFDASGDGRFNESAGDERISGVEITIGDVTVTTDADGEFRAASVSSGQQSVTANHSEYEVAPMSAAVAVEPETTVTHNVALQLRPVDASGLVVWEDEDGNEQAAPTTQVTFIPDEDGTGRPGETITNEDGRFVVDLAPGTYTVDAYYPHPDGRHFIAEDVTVTVERGVATVDLGTIVLTRTDDPPQQEMDFAGGDGGFTFES